MDAVDEAQVNTFIDRLESAWKEGQKVLFMGNGGSHATVSHMCNDFQKCMDLECGKPMKSICLSDCTPLLMAWANDTEYPNIFAPQIKCWVEPGDLVIGVSGSGNSPNVINGIEMSNKLGAHTFGLAGYDGGKLAKTAAECIVINSFSMQQVEDMHMILFHIAFCAVRDRNLIPAV